MTNQLTIFQLVRLVLAGLILSTGGLATAQQNSLNLQEILKNIEKESKWVIDTISPESREQVYQLSAGVLAQWIELSKRNAIDSGVHPMPETLQVKLRPYFSQTLIDRVRFRIGDQSAYSLSSLSFEYGDAGAITLDNVIVFYSADNANNAALWAHELHHVHQYRNWGVRQFAQNYLHNWQAIEKEAEDAQLTYSRTSKRK